MPRVLCQARFVTSWFLIILTFLAGGCVPASSAAQAVVSSDSPPAAPTEPPTVTLQVYFTNVARFAAATPPFEEAVTRVVPAGVDLPSATLHAFFTGPTDEEKASGLEAVTSGFTGLRELVIEGGIARVYLEGPCNSNGATYTVAQPIIANLMQYEEVKAVKIYDADGVTEVPEGMDTSIPYCLEP